ncbi:MAG TPA: M13 family metallopeptidase [Xanthomonadales bacterium]|nr:M13 family metallopeptidase [Xanthomonadales bacterium]
MRNVQVCFMLAVALMVSVACSNDQPAETTSQVTPGPAPEAVTEPSASPPMLRSGVDIDALDPETSAVDNFYQYVNGGWLDSTPIPSIYSGYTVYHQVNEEAEEALREIIEEAANNPGEAGTERQQVGDIYSSWMDEATIDSLGIEPVREELDLVESISDTKSLASVMGQLKRLGITVPFTFAVIPDLRDSSRYAGWIWQSGLTLPDRDYYLELENENFAEARDKLPAYMAGMLRRAGWDGEQAETDAASIFALETQLAEYQWDAVDNRDPEKIFNPYQVSELASLGPNLDWGNLRTALGIEDQEQLIIEQPSYFEGLDSMIASVPIEQWKAYLTFRVLDRRGLHLDAETAAVRFDYRNRVLGGQQEQQPRWKLGVAMVNGMVGEAVGKLYVEEYFPPEAKQRMEQMVDNIIATLDDDLDDLAWMSPETREKAQEKLAKFTPKIGYPDVWKDYSDLTIVSGDHMGNIRRSTIWDHDRDLNKLAGPVDKTEWQMTPQTVNAYYDPTKNEIVFPAARLQPPFFQLDADDAINYGAVGGVIGHEISHGFDDSGSKFDGDGNLENWWTDEDRAAFEERTTVLVDQYAGFEPVEGMNVNGELTLGENIGDLSGVAMAYRAYIRSLNGEEPPVIDGFTGPQRFFIGYAMSRKGKYQEEAEISRLASDPHSPLEYRVNGVYPNIDAFHEAFGTQEGDGMWLSPEDRVRIW